MACPLFLPDAPPAGFDDFHEGKCAGEPGAGLEADLLRRGCNNGYARGFCARAAASESDAFRFLVKARHEGDAVEIAWSSERDHHPVAVGTLTVKAAVAGGSEGAAADPLERQAWACAAAYLRRTGG